MNVKEVREQVRMQEWTELIRERNDSGMTIKEWCESKGLSENQYYYWLRKIRWTACAALQTRQNILPEEHADPPVFAEINVVADGPSAGTTSGILIRLDGADIHIGNDIGTDQLTAVMKVIAHAE